MPTPTSSPAPSSPTLLVRWLRFGVGVLLIWVLYLVTPTFFAAFPLLKEYNQVVQETDIRPGAMFYNDVPQSIEAQMSNRDAIRYFVRQKQKAEKK